MLQGEEVWAVPVSRLAHIWRDLPTLAHCSNIPLKVAATDDLCDCTIAGEGASFSIPAGSMLRAAMADDNPNHDFAMFINGASPAEPAMPLMHTTDLYRFRDILRTKKLQPKECSVFGEKLLYFFYGRPAYKPNQSVENTSQLSYRPICFVLKPQSLLSVKRAYPFDSGAFHAKMFEQHVHSEMRLPSFDISTIPKNTSKLVSAFFGDNKSYYFGKPTQGLALPNFQFEAQSYYSLIGDTSKTAYDGRRGTAELQSGDELVLGKETIAAVVLPTDFCEESVVRDVVLNEWDAALLPYPSYHAAPSEDIRSIFDCVASFLEENNFFGIDP